MKIFHFLFMSRRWHIGGARIGIVAKPSAKFVGGILETLFNGSVSLLLGAWESATLRLSFTCDEWLSVLECFFLFPFSFNYKDKFQ